MSTGTSASFWLTLLSVVLSVSGERGFIRAEPGQNVSLPCKALNNEPVIIVDWSRTEPKPEEELLSYRDEKLVTLKNRVDLQDRQMKDGDVSLILKDVTTDDSGTYECYVETKTKRRKRDAGNITIIKLHVVSERGTIRAESGQTVSLPCKALNNEPVSVVEWSKTDPKPEEELLLYRDEKFVTLKNRVDLQDRQMKDGDVSLILKDVTTDDSGTYECYVDQREKNIIKKFLDSISIIRLDVFPPGHKEERGDKEEGGHKEGGHKDGSVGLIVGLIVAAAVLVVVVGFLIFRRRRHPGPYHPPPGPDPDTK
ncbi:matrix remodeling-associated protein 8-like isoform X1 [Mugil cephalus]|uniref:matrix remodeling-associated protein 8-like isoform X1 n=1 Tax=Mugil cephalus TaxID=48193 RepID=UPI001FB7C48B|nr:matrix remodeling-associated protein 8-like isoform X1 [Mugil cephalus]